MKMILIIKYGASDDVPRALVRHGLAMAWQLRRQRRLSLLVIASGIVASVALLARVIPGLLE